MIRSSIVIIILVILNGSCSQGSKEKIVFLNKLQNEVANNYQTSKLNIHLYNNEILEMTFSDKKFDDFSSASKQKMATEIGKLANSFRNADEKIIKGTVHFKTATNYTVLKRESTERFLMY